MHRPISYGWRVIFALWLAGHSVIAANVLTNPGFELDPPTNSRVITGWTAFGPNVYNHAGAPVRSGQNSTKFYQAFTGNVNTSGLYQDYISGPGAMYRADTWACALSGDLVKGQNAAWMEITFRAADQHILALYRSYSINTNALQSGRLPIGTWVDLAVTNQLDLRTFLVTNTTTTLVAPPGTYFVRCQLTFQGDAANSAGSVYFDDVTLNQFGGSPYGNWNILWSDEFNGSTLDPKIWTFDTGGTGWGNNELEYYTSSPANAYASNGLLHIVARQQSLGGRSYTSARIKTQGLASWTYGRFEWRARLPSGVGFWPGLWLLGTNISTVGWPKCGEIDVMENKGAEPTIVRGSLHSGSDETAPYTLPSPGVVTDFHTYVLDWATNAVLWYVDGHLYEVQTNWTDTLGPYPTPFDQPFFIIMNLAVGGNFLGNPTMPTIDANSTFPGELQVDYVRIYGQTAPLKLKAASGTGTIEISWPTNVVSHLQAQATPGARQGSSTNWIDLPSANPAVLRTTNAVELFRLASP